MHPQTITETFLRDQNHIASGFILYQLFLQHPSLPALMCKINLHASESTTKELIAISGPVPNYLGPLDVILPFFTMNHEGFFLRWIYSLYVFSRHQQFLMLSVPKNELQSKDNSEIVFKHPNLDSIFRRLLQTTMPAFFSLVPDSLHLAQILCTLFFIAAELQLHDFKSHYIWALNLNSIPITNGSTETHNYNAQIKFCMRLCKTYVYKM